MEEHARGFRLPGTPEGRGWTAWVVLAVVIAVILVAKVNQSHVTKTYFPTAETWWGGEHDIYTPGIKGYLYLPQSVHLFSLFLVFPEGPVREIAWRLFGLALLAFGLRRVLRRVTPGGGARHFELVTILILLATVSSARNGQTNLHLAGIMLHACADLIDKRWWRATLWLWGGMLAKPIAAVMLLLVGALVPAMRGRLAVGLVAFAALPYLHLDPSYVTEQYRLAFEKLGRSSQPGAKPYDDMIGILRRLGIELPQLARTAMAGAMALVTLGLAALAMRRGSRREGFWALTALAAAYLMLFNPRTETNSYVILAPWLAMQAAFAWFNPPARKAARLGFTAGTLALGADNYGRAVLNASRGLVKPLVALGFYVWLAISIVRLPDRPLLPAASDAPDASA